MAVTIRRIEEHDDLDRFDCGDEPLNQYLRRHAWPNQAKSSIGVTYVAVEEAAPLAVLGYFTLAMASVSRNTLPKKYVRGLPGYDVPVLLLARLAVDRRFAGRGLGHALISEVFRLSLVSAWPTKLAADASSPTRIGTGPVGTRGMDSCRSREPLRAVRRGCFWIFGQSGLGFGLRTLESTHAAARYRPARGSNWRALDRR